jgi:hypothetical protein
MSTTFSSLLTSLRLSLRDPNGTTWSDGQLGELINRGIDAIGDVYQSEAIQSIAFTQPVSGSVFSVDLSTVTWPVRVDVYDAISKSATITAASGTSTITYTYSSLSAPVNVSSFSSGDVVSVSGISPSQFNISGTIVSATSSTFTIGGANITGSYASGGSVVTTAVPKYRETVRPSSGDGPDSGWETHGGILYLPTRYTLAVGTGTLNVVGYGPWTQINTSQTSSVTNLDTTAQNAVKVFVEAEALTMLTFDRAQYQQWQVSSGSSDISALGMNNLALAAQQRWRQEKNRIRRFRKGG